MLKSSQELEDQEEQSDWSPDASRVIKVTFSRADIARGIVFLIVFFVMLAAELAGLRDFAVMLLARLFPHRL